MGEKSPSQNLKPGYLEKDPVKKSQQLRSSQQFFAEHKHGQLLTQVHDHSQHGVHIQDVSPEMDFAYAATYAVIGEMKRADFQRYQKSFDALPWAKISAPDLLIFLDIAFEAYQHREFRPFEKGIRPDLFLAMKTVNNFWWQFYESHYPHHALTFDATLEKLYEGGLGRMES